MAGRFSIVASSVEFKNWGFFINVVRKKKMECSIWIYSIFLLRLTNPAHKTQSTPLVGRTDTWQIYELTFVRLLCHVKPIRRATRASKFSSSNLRTASFSRSLTSIAQNPDKLQSCPAVLRVPHQNRWSLNISTGYFYPQFRFRNRNVQLKTGLCAILPPSPLLLRPSPPLFVHLNLIWSTDTV